MDDASEADDKNVSSLSPSQGDENGAGVERQATRKRPTHSDRGRDSDNSESRGPTLKKLKVTSLQRTNTNGCSDSGIRLKDLCDAAQERLPGSNSQALNEHVTAMMNYKSVNRPPSDARVPRSLSPILLQPNNPNQLPSTLQRLDPETRVDVFNRRTRKIMTGEGAIRIRDLPQALLMHSEYEPIIPRVPDRSNHPFETTCTSRVGRSAPNVRVRQSVSPQVRSQTKRKGERVVIVQGPYRGFIGEIETSTTGGWYIVRRVRDEHEELAFPLVVGPQHIEVTSEESSRDNGTAAPEQSSNVADSTYDDVISSFEDDLAEHHRDLMLTLRESIEDLSKEERSLAKSLEHCHRHNNTGAFDEDAKTILSLLRKVRGRKSNVEDELEFEMDCLAAMNRMQVPRSQQTASQLKFPVENASETTTQEEDEPMATSSDGVEVLTIENVSSVSSQSSTQYIKESREANTVGKLSKGMPPTEG